MARRRILPSELFMQQYIGKGRQNSSTGHFQITSDDVLYLYLAASSPCVLW